MLGIAKEFGMRAGICGQGEPLDFVYEVEKGAVRTVKILSDGRRKISGFYCVGDIFGLEDGNEHALSAEAVVPSIVHVIKRRTLLQVAADQRELAEDGAEVAGPVPALSMLSASPPSSQRTSPSSTSPCARASWLAP